jgi:plastocyanin
MIVLRLFIAVSLSILVTFVAPAYAQNQTQTQTLTETDNVRVVTIVQGAQFEENRQPDYNPPIITVEPGAKIIWKNEDYPDKTDPSEPDTVRHTATSGVDALPDGWFLTDILQSGNSSKPIEMPWTEGIYPYFCIMHPGWVNGTVIVKSGDDSLDT